MTATEEIVSSVPLIVRRRVKWGDCDPAGVVYTPVFAEYVMSAAELFYGNLFGKTPQRARKDLGFGTPSRALQFDFRHSIRPDEDFEMTVTVAGIRERTYVLEITGRTLTGEVIFVSQLTPICIARDERRSIMIPEAFRVELERYRDACGADGEGGR